MKRGRVATDVRLNELANRLRDIEWRDPDHILFDYRQDCFQLGDHWHHVNLQRNGETWAVRLSFHGKLLTLGITNEIPDALIFADLARERFAKYRVNTGVGAPNIRKDIMDELRGDNEDNFERAEILLNDIENYLVAVGYVDKLGDYKVQRRRRTVREEILHDFSHIKTSVFKIEEKVEAVRSLLVAVAKRLRVDVPSVLEVNAVSAAPAVNKDSVQARIDEIVALEDSASDADCEELARLCHLVRKV